MIEISARLNGGAVYFANETIKCAITVKNVSSLASVSSVANETNGDDQLNQHAIAANGDERLGWVSVQIHCYCTADDTKVSLIDMKEEQTPMASTQTSFNPCLMKGEKGRVVFASKPKILFCDLKLVANESKCFVYYETIPNDAPPSFNGSKVKYQYKLSIGTQRVNAAIQLLRIPIRVLTITNTAINNSMTNLNNHNDVVNHIPDYSPPETPQPSQRVTTAVTSSDTSSDTTTVNSTVSASVNNSLTQTSEFDANQTVLDLSLHKLDCLTAKRCPSNYVIANQFGKVVKFCLIKSTYKLGEDIVGVFNFTEATVPCVQFSVTLQSEEVIAEEYRVKQGKPSSFTQIISYGKYNDFCLHMRYTQMIISIPLTVTPTFTSNIVSLSWKLHFEFVTTKNEDIKPIKIVDSHGVMEQSPPQLNVQTMVWDLPIIIFPTHPIQVARGFQIPANSSLTI